MKKYYIYHIKGVKIGVSEEPNNRTKKQGFDNYEIIETHTCIYEVSKREQELQKQYGYPVDKIPYYISRKNWGSKAGKVGGRKAVESGQIYEMIANRDKNYLIETGNRLGKTYGVINGKNSVKSGQLAIARIKAFETNYNIVTCQYCNKQGRKLAMTRWHGENCKYKN
jgi:hypothetical protein